MDNDEAGWRSVATAVQEWLWHARDKYNLAHLNERELRDIGLQLDSFWDERARK